MEYEAPTIEDLGSILELTQVHKTGGSGDTFGPTNTPIPGSSVGP